MPKVPELLVSVICILVIRICFEFSASDFGFSPKASSIAGVADVMPSANVAPGAEDDGDNQNRGRGH
jgi:hypothetical protein